MYEFYLDNKKHSIKTSWEELSPDEFIDISGLLERFRKGEFNLVEVRTLVVLVLLGLKGRHLRLPLDNHLAENIYMLSREVNFFYKIQYENQKSFASLSAETRSQLLHSFPEELPETPEIRAAIKMKKQVVIDMEFGKNILQQICHGRQRYPGYLFTTADGIAHTSLTALQFSEAQKIIAQYANTESDQLLDLLCGILYQPGPYSESLARERAQVYSKLPREVKLAVLLNFCALTNYIVHRTKYAILFEGNRKTKKAGLYSLGLADNIYMLSKKGYGDSLVMENSNLFKFLDLLLKELTDQIAELKATGKKKDEISEIMDLSISQINDLLP